MKLTKEQNEQFKIYSAHRDHIFKIANKYTFELKSSPEATAKLLSHYFKNVSFDGQKDPKHILINGEKTKLADAAGILIMSLCDRADAGAELIAKNLKYVFDHDALEIMSRWQGQKFEDISKEMPGLNSPANGDLSRYGGLIMLDKSLQDKFLGKTLPKGVLYEPGNGWFIKLLAGTPNERKYRMHPRSMLHFVVKTLTGKTKQADKENTKQKAKTKENTL